MKAQEESADYLVRSPETNWRRGTLGELLPIKYGKSLPEKLRDTTGSHPVFGSSGQVGAHSAALTAGPTLIIGRKGNVGAIHYSSEACWPIDTVYYVEPPEGQNLRYYKYLLESLNLVKLDKSTAVPGLSRDDYNAVEVVVAPPHQQDGMVAEIEKQFSRLDEAVANLKRVKANLKRYKAAVLKAAVEGRLVETEAELARREGRSYETGEQLLQHILETRRSQWQGKGKYKEPAAPATTGLPELPEGWCWVTVDAIAFVTKLAGFEYTKSVKYDDLGELAVIKAENVGCEGFKITNFSFVRKETVSHLVRSEVKAGDLLVPFVGSLGNVARVPSDRPYFLGPNVALVRIVSKQVEPAFLELYLKSPVGKQRTLNFAKAVAQASLSMGTIRSIPVALPPLSDQHYIVVEVDRRFSLVREVEAQVDANLKRAERLRQSVLSKAFSGGNS